MIEDGKDASRAPKTIADVLGVGRSATYDRIKDALLARLPRQRAPRRTSAGYKLVLGAELPAAGEDFLPAADVIVRHLSGSVSRTKPWLNHAGFGAFVR